MNIAETLLYYANNRRGDCRFIEQNLILKDSEKLAFAAAQPALHERLNGRLKDSGITGDFLAKMEKDQAGEPGIAFAALYCDLALALQQAAGHQVYARDILRDHNGKGVWAWFEFEHDELAYPTAALAIGLILEAVPELERGAVADDEMENLLNSESSYLVQKLMDTARPLALPRDVKAMMEAASQAGIPCVRLDQDPFQGFVSAFRKRPDRLLKLGHGQHQLTVDGTFCIDRCRSLLAQINDREAMRKHLLNAGFPVPPRDPATGNCIMFRRALRAAANVGYPVVVKPGRREHGADVALAIETDVGLKNAIDAARSVSSVVSVEGMVAGESNRLLLANHRVLGFVRGDREFTPDLVHESTMALAEKLSLQLNTGMLSLDVVTADISRSLTDTGGAAVDLNLAPDLDALLPPNSALMEQAVEAFLQYLYPQGQASRNPIVTVTGTNGKTTTTRMIARIMQRAGHHTGLNCSDGVYIGKDFEGRNSEYGASSQHHILSSPEVDFAVFEEWFGRICRAGFAYKASDVAVCLNVTNDHLGRIGTHTMEQMAAVKESVVARASKAAVLNADDPYCLAMAPRMTARNVCLVSLGQGGKLPAQDLSQELYRCNIEPVNGNDWIVLHGDGRRLPITAVNDIPATFNGTASFITSNAMHAAAACYLAGATAEAIQQGLQSFSMDFNTTPSRLNVFDDLPFRVIMDYASNPDSFRKLSAFVDLQDCGGRKVITAAMPGDRRDEEFFASARELAGHYDHYVCRNFEDTRGRPAAEIPELMRTGLLAAGVPEDAITVITDASAAIDYCIDTATGGDLIVLQCYDPEFSPTWEKLQRLSSEWKQSKPA